MTVAKGGRCRALLPMNSWPVEVMIFAGMVTAPWDWIRGKEVRTC